MHAALITVTQDYRSPIRILSFDDALSAETQDHAVVGGAEDFKEETRTSRAILDLNCTMILAGRRACVAAPVCHFDSMHPKVSGRRGAGSGLAGVVGLRYSSFGSVLSRSGVRLQPLPPQLGHELSAGQLLREISGHSEVSSRSEAGGRR